MAKNTNQEAIKLLQDKSALDLKKVISYTMHYCGCTYQEIGDVFGLSRQQAKNIVDNLKKSLE